jgi:uncharacterized membrane protein YedE/YeeE
MSGRTVHRSGTVLLSVAMVAIGLALIGQILAGTGTVLSARMLLGLLFLAAGIARLYLERKRGRQS